MDAQCWVDGICIVCSTPKNSGLVAKRSLKLNLSHLFFTIVFPEPKIWDYLERTYGLLNGGIWIDLNRQCLFNHKEIRTVAKRPLSNVCWIFFNIIFREPKICDHFFSPFSTGAKILTRNEPRHVKVMPRVPWKWTYNVWSTTKNRGLGASPLCCLPCASHSHKMWYLASSFHSCLKMDPLSCTTYRISAGFVRGFRFQ